MDTLLVGAAGAAGLGVFVSGYLTRALRPGCPGFWARYVEVMFLLTPALLASFGDGPRQQLRLALLGVFAACVWLGLAVYDRRGMEA
jgi:hypothetical protein